MSGCESMVANRSANADADPIKLQGTTQSSLEIVRELRDRGLPASKKRVERLMRENNIHVWHKRRLIRPGHIRYHLPMDRLISDHCTWSV